MSDESQEFDLQIRKENQKLGDLKDYLNANWIGKLVVTIVTISFAF